VENHRALGRCSRPWAPIPRTDAYSIHAAARCSSAPTTKKFLRVPLLALLTVASTWASAQLAGVPATDHAPLLVSPDARLAENKRLVYDFWREVFEAAHMD
jgi:hypothetical protein